MSTILESVNTLSEKLGVTEREQTIKDQLDLCVERLGGEGNSKDIAESAEKFAEKEDGTATFMTKTITENNTYNAADDGVSGYSSVTVDVDASFNEIKTRYVTPDNSRLLLLRTKTGTYTYDKNVSNATVILCDPVSAVYGLSYFDTGSFTFTPASDFSGFYIGDSESGGSWTLTGDTITPGDGKLYTLNIARVQGGTKTFVVATSYVDFDFTIS